MSLARLLEQARPGPWWYRVDDGDEWWFGGRTDDGGYGKQATIRTDEMKFDALAVMGCNNDEELATARLIALAPDMAQLLIDVADALRRLDAWDHMATAHDGRYWREDVIAPLLAWFADLDGQAKDTT